MQRSITFLFTFLFVIAISFPSFSQKKNDDEPQIEAPTFKTDDEGNVIYTGVVEQAGSPAELYERNLSWFGEFYTNPNGVIQEKNEGENIKGKARFNIYIDDANTGTKSNAGLVQYTIDVMFKEGRYKYDITRIHKKASSYQGIEKWIESNNKQYSYAYATYLTQVDEYFQNLIADMKKGMQPVVEKSDDW